MIALKLKYLHIIMISILWCCINRLGCELNIAFVNVLQLLIGQLGKVLKIQDKIDEVLFFKTELSETHELMLKDIGEGDSVILCMTSGIENKA